MKFRIQDQMVYGHHKAQLSFGKIFALNNLQVVSWLPQRVLHKIPNWFRFSVEANILQNCEYFITLMSASY
jgi:hypothetical protein